MPTITPVRSADTHVHRLYAEYAGMPVGVVTQCVQHFASLHHVTWQACAGASWQDKASVYYEQHEDYMFDLLHRSTSRAQRKATYISDGHWTYLAGPARDVLDFGGGLGLAASLLAEVGKAVTYCDVDGPAANFAEWYFEQCGQAIEVHRTPAREAVLPTDRRWDLVLVESVLEHVPDPAATIGRLARVVRSGGTLYLIVDPVEPPAAQPMRRRIDVDELLAGSPELRAMHHVLRGDRGQHAFFAC